MYTASPLVDIPSHVKAVRILSCFGLQRMFCYTSKSLDREDRRQSEENESGEDPVRCRVCLNIKDRGGCFYREPCFECRLLIHDR